LIDHELGNARVAHERLGDVDAEGSVREIAHLLDLELDLVELPRRGLDDPHRSRVRDRRGELRACDPSHRSLNDRDLDAQHATDAIVEFHVLPSCLFGVAGEKVEREGRACAVSRAADPAR